MKHVLSVSCLALASLLALPASASEQVGVNAAIRNQVEMKTDADSALRPAKVRDPVHLGDLIVSGKESALQMLMLDHSVFTIGADARMTIDRFVYDPDRGTTDIAASVARGAFRFMSGRLTGPAAGKSAIRTPVATIGVRGTIVEGVVGPDVLNVLSGEPGVPAFTGNPDDAVLILLNGPGRNSGTFDKPGAIDVTGDNGTTSIEHGGVAVVFFPGQPLFGPFELSDDAFARLEALLNAQSRPGRTGLCRHGLGCGGFRRHPRYRGFRFGVPRRSAADRPAPARGRPGDQALGLGVPRRVNRGRARIVIAVAFGAIARGRLRGDQFRLAVAGCAFGNRRQQQIGGARRAFRGMAGIAGRIAVRIHAMGGHAVIETAARQETVFQMDRRDFEIQRFRIRRRNDRVAAVTRPALREHRAHAARHRIG